MSSLRVLLHMTAAFPTERRRRAVWLQTSSSRHAGRRRGQYATSSRRRGTAWRREPPAQAREQMMHVHEVALCGRTAASARMMQQACGRESERARGEASEGGRGAASERARERASDRAIERGCEHETHQNKRPAGASTCRNDVVRLNYFTGCTARKIIRLTTCQSRRP